MAKKNFKSIAHAERSPIGRINTHAQAVHRAIRRASALLVGLCALNAALVVTPAAASEVEPSEYKSVEEALKSLKERPDAKVIEREGWTAITLAGDGEQVLWSFTPIYHPAYPSAVKRRIYQKDGVVLMEMRVLCESSDAACDGLTIEFQALNERMRKSLQEQAAKKQ